MTARLLARRRRWAGVLAAPVPGAAGPRSRSVRPELDPVHAAHAAWHELRADAIDFGLAWRPSDSPRAAAHRLGRLIELDPAAEAALSRIARAEERARYARTPMAVDTLRTDVRLVREAFASSADRRTRLRARLAPPSALASFRSTGAGLLDAIDRLDALAAALRDRLRRR